MLYSITYNKDTDKNITSRNTTKEEFDEDHIGTREGQRYTRSCSYTDLNLLKDT